MRNHALVLCPIYRGMVYLFAILWLGLFMSSCAFAQTFSGSAQPLVTQSINDLDLAVLGGNTRPEARNPTNDRGIVADGLPMEHLQLQLRRPAAQEQALVTLIDQLHDPKSPNFHHWLGVAEFGARFSPAISDIAAVTGWLAQHGFAVNAVYPSGMVIDFSGTAGAVRAAFHAEIHNLDVNGTAHVANISDPQIPAALAPVVAGVVSLHDFKAKPLHTAAKQAQQKAQYSAGGGCFIGTCELITPADLATIYNFNPLFAAGITGQGQTIYVIENSYIYSLSDWTTFRSVFGIPFSSYPGVTFSEIEPPPPSGPTNCSYPGTVNDYEATLDAEWASAAAPGASIVVAACGDSGTPLTPNFTNGILIALQNLVSSNPPPAIMSVSYGVCETLLGSAANMAFSSVYQQGVAEGASIYVAAGDSDAAECDSFPNQDTVALYGITVGGYASTQYNVAVGGTDFSDVYSAKFGGPAASTYWNSSNTATYGSAKSYIPEIPWNDTCASELIATYNGASTTYGTGFCSTAPVKYFPIIGGGGGPSGCATGTPSSSSPQVVSGSCAGWPKPSWQSAYGFTGLQERRRARYSRRVDVRRRRRMESLSGRVLFGSQQPIRKAVYGRS